MSRIAGLVVMTAFAAAPAAAQDNALRAAADAFGERQGIEQVGLYNEGQVRGFDLNNSGAYRIEDSYFARASGLNDPVLAGVAVRVGVNAARLAYPAPSGVVNYRLREPGPHNQFSLGAGLRDFGTRTLEGNGSWKDDEDRFGLAGGFVARPEVRWGGGTEGEALDLGVVGSWRVTPAHRIRAFASAYMRRYDGDYAMKPTDGVLPPDPRGLHNYSPEWAKVDGTNTNVGLLYDGAVAGWAVNLSGFHSIFDTDRSDFTLIETRADGSARGTTFITPGKTSVSDSAEARASRVFEVGGLSHLVSGSVRARRSRVDLTSSLAAPLGAFTLRTNPAPSAEPVWSGQRGRDSVDQVTASLGYGLAWRDRVQLRFGVHRTRYEKSVLTLGGERTRGESEETLFNASAIVNLTDRTAVFGSWVTGLEESGVAPQSAANRNEVLPPVKAEQFELGVRQAIGDLTFIGAVFDVSKPTTGFRADGAFDLVGRVRHRGIEGSLAGKLGEKTNVVLGAVVFQPKVSGPLVEAGVIGDRAFGVSSTVINASVERQLADGWSVDAQFTWWGERWADSRNTFKAPAVPQLNIGARRRFELAGRPATFRVLASNITGEEGWWASPSGLIWPIAPRTARAMLTLAFGPGA
ncbi:MAG: TonB-dependent receptor [Pseudomonadota bacterium]